MFLAMDWSISGKIAPIKLRRSGGLCVSSQFFGKPVGHYARNVYVWKNLIFNKKARHYKHALKSHPSKGVRQHDFLKFVFVRRVFYPIHNNVNANNDRVGEGSNQYRIVPSGQLGGEEMKYQAEYTKYQKAIEWKNFFYNLPNTKLLLAFNRNVQILFFLNKQNGENCR
jgi:hypothetical protein